VIPGRRAGRAPRGAGGSGEGPQGAAEHPRGAARGPGPAPARRGRSSQTQAETQAKGRCAETACFPGHDRACSGAHHRRSGTEADDAATRRLGLAGPVAGQLSAIPNVSIGLACATAEHVVGTTLAIDLAGSAVRGIFAIEGPFVAGRMRSGVAAIRFLKWYRGSLLSRWRPSRSP